MIWSLGKNRQHLFRQPAWFPLCKRPTFLWNSAGRSAHMTAPFLNWLSHFFSTTWCCCNVPYPLLLFTSVPGAVCHINATVLSDTSLHVIWTESDRPNGPQESVRYQLVMSHLAPIPETPLRQGEFPSARLALLVTKLSGGQLYVLKVLGDWVFWALLIAIFKHMFWEY